MSIRVKVYAPGFVNHDSINPDGFVEVKEGDSVSDLYKKLKLPIPLRLVMACSVNYEKVKSSRKLIDGDVVTFLFPISGG